MYTRLKCKIMHKVFLIIYVFATLYIPLSKCTISPTSNKIKEKTVKPKELKKGPLQSSVFDRNLVVDKPNSKDILRENQAYFENTDLRNFNGSVLGYVTPWNGHGYDVARTWSNKFSMVSPVWLQVVRKNEREYVVNGRHDIDRKWMESLHPTKVVPRVLFENWDQDDINSLEKPGELKALADALTNVCKDNDFDGLVLEIWFQFVGRLSNKKISHVTRKICSTLLSSQAQCVMVIPPWRGSDHPDLFTRSDFEYLFPHVSGFSLMTYDFSSPQRPGPNSPISWIRKCIEHLVPDQNEKLKRSSILMGMNLYGYAYTPQGGGALLAPDYINLLGYHKGKLKYDAEAQENFFEVRTSENRYVVFYPTLHSINTRIQLATEMGVGLALWELGQGLDYFYDLF